MFSDAELAEHRADAESLMDLCLGAYQPGTVLDDNDRKVPGHTFVGECIGKLQGSSASARDAADRTVRIGGVERPVLIAGLHIPICDFITDGFLDIVASEDPLAAWQFRVHRSRSTDHSLVGRWYQAVGIVPAKSIATARRLDVAEVPHARD